MQAGRGNFAARIGKELMSYFTECFGVAIPMPKNDHLYSKCLPILAMENSFQNVVEDDLFRHLEEAGREDGSWPPSDPAITQSFSSGKVHLIFP